MNAILALSARYLALKPPAHELILPGSINTLQYYNKTLHYIRKAMHYDTYKTSLELLATSLIISAYEMLDGSTQDWQRHLQGVFWIQRSQVIHGDSPGGVVGVALPGRMGGFSRETKAIHILATGEDPRRTKPV
jgi:hypothetical protein